MEVQMEYERKPFLIHTGICFIIIKRSIDLLILKLINK